MKKRFVMILALLVAYVAVFAAAGCTDADKNAEVSFSENYFVTYSDRSGRILIAARYGDEFYVKRSEALPNTYTEKAYYPVDGGWQVYIKTEKGGIHTVRRTALTTLWRIFWGLSLRV